jgi:outer membrane protein OmpA-like peptidoglycan-associated protein
MFKSKGKVIWWMAGMIPFVVAASGCATKKYVRNYVDPVSQHVSAVEAQTNEKIAALSAKEESDISAVNERISSTDLKATQAASAAAQAQGTASRAMEVGTANSDQIKAQSDNLAAVQGNLAGAYIYQFVDKADVMFGLNKSTLTKDAKATLDQLAQKVQSTTHPMVEVAGFTDKTGSASYNLVLSRKRAEAVQRYLAKQNVPIRQIQIIGMGEERPPADLALNPASADVPHMERRVQVRIYSAPGYQGTAARSQE